MTLINKKASFEYLFLKKYNAGMVLTGKDVKVIKAGSEVSFNGAFCTIENNEIFVRGLNVGGTTVIKLLLSKREIYKLKEDLVKGTTIVPYRLYQNEKGLFKLEIHLAKGKKLYDKRESIKTRDLSRELKIKL
jgi:SsrA-binding protein